MASIVKCVRGHVLFPAGRSAGCYYVGTYDAAGGPFCRVSGYYQSADLVEKALDTMSFPERICVENQHCSGGKGCLPAGRDMKKGKGA